MTKDKKTLNLHPALLLGTVAIVFLIQIAALLPGVTTPLERINYTMIGDNANLASRLQDLTKTYAWPILISESTYEQAKEEFDAESTVKGKTRPVYVYKSAPPSEQLQFWQK